MDLIDDPAPGQNTPEYSVSEISGAIKRTIEGEFGRVHVRGEVGRVVHAPSGHLYFDLKDDRNTLACNTWKGQVSGLDVMPEEGLEVVATGKMSAFGPQSKYNMNVVELAVAGQGALMAMLEKRKKALEAEGLFAAERKKPLPYLPEVIGVVTSPTGAVIRDILHRLRDRFPRKVLIWPVAVQGANCAPEVARGIAGFNALTPGGAMPRPVEAYLARRALDYLVGFKLS
ncbi:MAG: exodeoxyribonuclease VII large subunit, partial [Pseudomonadota bacterium]